ncbi:MAG: DUF2865 domain-containing protein [Pseudomonadota bacterium]
MLWQNKSARYLNTAKTLVLGFFLFSQPLPSFAQSIFDIEEPGSNTLDRPLNSQVPHNQPKQKARSPQCLRLEQKLARVWIDRSKPGRDRTLINQDIRKWDDELDLAESKADEFECYEGILFFGRTLRRTPRCRRLERRIEQAKDKLDELHEERSKFVDRDNSRQKDDIISELARLGCGAQYTKEDKQRNRIFSWDIDPFDDDKKPAPADQGNPLASKILPYATYRTMCVRRCDGFYYPVSFSTLPSRFSQDANTCQSKCAAPADLYVYRNPGENIEQMISLSGQAYSKTPSAFRFRKSFIKGCSCKVSEYKPELLSGNEKQSQNQGVNSDPIVSKK